jgi:transglutaminase-like putative cysteine protease
MLAVDARFVRVMSPTARSAGHAGPVSDAGAVRYRLRQSFRYDYDGPAYSLLHRLVVVPPVQHGDQRLRSARLVVTGGSAQVHWDSDGHGNRIGVVRLPVVQDSLTLSVDVVVQRSGRLEPPAPSLTDPRLLESSLLTVASPGVRQLAAAEAGGDPLAAAARVCHLVPELVRYTPGATSVRTTAAQALEQGQGVCQDQAHVMLAVCRAAGIACRYVSGHMIGQGGTHAWVEVVVAHGAGARVVAFDPCHGRRTDRRHVTVAVGRDYSDVPPTSGWYSGSARGTLTGERHLVAEDLTPTS